MDELWQRHRTFWTPVLLGLGVFLVGLIVVHIVTRDPEREARLMQGEANRLSSMQRPSGDLMRVLRERANKFEAQSVNWAGRLDASGSAGAQTIENGVERALRATFLRGADNAEAAQASRLSARFDDDTTQAERAWRRYEALLPELGDLLRNGDPNVAFSRLLNEVWAVMRVRANRADMEISDLLGFTTVSSVNRSTLPVRVATLALVTELVDEGLRNGMQAFDLIKIEANVTPDQPEAYLTEWVLGLGMEGPYGAVLAVLDRLAGEQRAFPMLAASVAQPRQRGGKSPDGTVRFEATVGTAVVRPMARLGLEKESA